MSRAIITNGFERGRGAILSEALAFPRHRIAVYDPPGGPFIPPIVEPVFPNPPGGGEWDPDGETVGGTTVTFPGDPGTVAPWLVPDPGDTATLTGATFTGGPTSCVGWKFILACGIDLCVAVSAAVNPWCEITITIGTQDGGDVVVRNVQRYMGGNGFCSGINAGANWTLASEAIIGGSHAADWTTATNCKGNGEGVLSGGTIPTGQVLVCCGGFARAVWKELHSCIFRTGGGAGATAVSLRFDFASAFLTGFGPFTHDLT